jgi:DNA-binding Lrp family transcriptional regulator
MPSSRTKNIKKPLLKDVELRLVSELMKDSRRSDRNLAKATGVSQPTVSRLIKKLEKDGVIREFTMVPDFRKLGYKIMAVIFLKLGHNKHPLSQDELKEMYRKARELETDDPRNFLLVYNGIGLNHDMMVISFFHDYSEYASYVKMVKEESYNVLSPFIKPNSIDGFLINLEEETHYQPLTFSRLAKNLVKESKSYRNENFNTSKVTKNPPSTESLHEKP